MLMKIEELGDKADLLYKLKEVTLRLNAAKQLLTSDEGIELLKKNFKLTLEFLPHPLKPEPNVPTPAPPASFAKNND